MQKVITVKMDELTLTYLDYICFWLHCTRGKALKRGIDALAKQYGIRKEDVDKFCRSHE